MSFGKQSFSLDFSLGELTYLASVFGETRLLLPGLGKIDNQLKAETAFEIAEQTLQQRGLICDTGNARCQVDRVAASIIRFLSTPDVVVTLRIYSRQEKNMLLSTVYRLDGSFLFLQCKDIYRFTFFQKNSDLFSSLIALLNLEEKRSLMKTSTPLHVVQPEYLLPLLWQAPEKAISALKHFNISDEIIEGTVKQLKKCGQWSMIEQTSLGRNFLQCEERLFIVTSKKHLWSGILPSNKEAPCELDAETVATVEKQLSGLLYN